MRQGLHGLPLALAVLIGLGTLAGLGAAFKRLQVEDRNKSVEIALEWAEVYQLSQATQQPVATVLQRLKAERLTTLVITDDSLSALESTGAIRPTRMPLPEGHAFTRVEVDGPQTLHRIQTALKTHAIQSEPILNPDTNTLPGSTVFVLRPALPQTQPLRTVPAHGRRAPAESSPPPDTDALVVPVNYTNLRPLGVGLPPEALETARKLHLRIAGRIANFPGVSVATAQSAIQALYAQGARLVIFYGDDVLGYRGLEKDVAALLRDPKTATVAQSPEADLPASGLTYGDVEFGKQKGSEKLSAALKGSFVRVHSIQLAEMGQMDENEMLERFIKAVRERNIRFCYVRLYTLAGDDPISENVTFLHKIREGLEHGNAATGGGFKFGAAHRYADPGVPALLFGLIGLGTAAAIVWMVRAFCPVSPRLSLLLLIILCLVCGGLAAVGGESGRKIVALLAGIALPAVACLRTFPHAGEASERETAKPLPSRSVSLKTALRKIAVASAITALGIVQVVGLLASRPFMVHASQFLGIKAQHAIPLLLVALAALLGGVPAPGESWRRYRQRATERLQAAYDEPARFGLLVLGIVALAGLAVVVARTGNDSGVGVSGFELRFRAILDMILVARPRTKEFLVGHPAFILGWAWWLRGRRNLALPLLIVGSLGQVSMLNTFCHIHTPLVISIWRDLLGLLFGALLGVGVFLCVDPLLPTVALSGDQTPEEDAVPQRPVFRSF